MKQPTLCTQINVVDPKIHPWVEQLLHITGVGKSKVTTIVDVKVIINSGSG